MKKALCMVVLHLAMCLSVDAQADRCFAKCWENLTVMQETSDDIRAQLTAGRFVLDGLHDCPLPTFQATCMDGRIVDAQTVRDKVVVLNFWFIACPPCISEIPHLNDLYDRFSNREDVVFLAFSKDKASDIRSFLEAHPFSYPIVSDSKAYDRKFCALAGYPMHMIFDQQGRLAFVTSGVNTNDDGRYLVAKMADKIEALLDR